MLSRFPRLRSLCAAEAVPQGVLLYLGCDSLEGESSIIIYFMYISLRNRYTAVDLAATPEEDLIYAACHSKLSTAAPGRSATLAQVVRVRSREARRIREPPKRFRPSDNKKDGAPGGPGGAGRPGGPGGPPKQA